MKKPASVAVLCLAVLFSIVAPASALGIGGMLSFDPKVSFADPASPDFDGVQFATGLTFSVTQDNLPFYFSLETSYDILAKDFDVNAIFDFPVAKYSCGVTPDQLAVPQKDNGSPPIANVPAPKGTGDFSFYFALGVLAGSTIEKDNAKLNAAPRAVFCFSWEKLDGFLEPFLQIAVQPTFVLDFMHDEATFLLQFPVGVGVRVWD